MPESVRAAAAAAVQSVLARYAPPKKLGAWGRLMNIMPYLSATAAAADPEGPTIKTKFRRIMKIAFDRARKSFEKIIGNPGLNHEPQVVIYAEFESGIGNGWKVDKNMVNIHSAAKLRSRHRAT